MFVPYLVSMQPQEPFPDFVTLGQQVRTRVCLLAPFWLVHFYLHLHLYLYLYFVARCLRTLASTSRIKSIVPLVRTAFRPFPNHRPELHTALLMLSRAASQSDPPFGTVPSAVSHSRNWLR